MAIRPTRDRPSSRGMVDPLAGWHRVTLGVDARAESEATADPMRQPSPRGTGAYDDVLRKIRDNVLLSLIAPPTWQSLNARDTTVRRRLAMIQFDCISPRAAPTRKARPPGSDVDSPWYLPFSRGMATREFAGLAPSHAEARWMPEPNPQRHAQTWRQPYISCLSGVQDVYSRRSSRDNLLSVQSADGVPVTANEENQTVALSVVSIGCSFEVSWYWAIDDVLGTGAHTRPREFRSCILRSNAWTIRITRDKIPLP